MRSLHGAVGIVAVMAKLRTTNAHPGCFTPNETPNMEAVLNFCPLEESGACCTPTQEQDVITLYEKYGPLTSNCAGFYKQVVCGACSSYAIHLYEVLGNDLGLEDGMTMKQEFCEDFMSACDGEIPFPDYDGVSYCDKHAGTGDDLLWSYPLDSSLTDGFESTGLVKAFPELDDNDLPNKLIAMHMTPDGSEWWMAGQTGEMMKVSSDNPSSSTMVLDLTTGVDLLEAYEEGLLDFALSPDFHNNGYFYCSYTISDEDGHKNRLSRFTYDSGSIDITKGSILILLTSATKATTIHSAGWVGFQPSDYGNTGVHDLYWAIGDGGPQEDPHRTGGDSSSTLASIVRITVSTNSDAVGLNPSGNIEGPVCATGFRNPFRCGFDSATDELYCADVGHTKVEEIDLVVCGNDYGWSRFEGSRCQEDQQDDFDEPCESLSRSGLTFPIYQYCHPDFDSTDPSEDEFTGGEDICGSRAIQGNAVIAGYVYHGEMFGEVLGGALLFAEAQKGNLYYLFKEGDEWVPGTIISDGSESIISFAEANNGEIFLIHADRTPYLLPCGDLCATTCLDQVETQPVYQSLGCFADYSNNRALNLAAGTTCPEGEDLMSPAICSSYCATVPGATLFGVEYAFQCFCGSASDDYDKHGSLDSESCGTSCTGTPDEFCGGTNAIEVYSFSDGVPATPSPVDMAPPTPTTTPTEFTSLGCFEDYKGDRVLSTMFEDETLTTEGCAEKCKLEGSTYFGTEYSVECFCSTAGDSTTGLGSDATCNLECSGDTTEICGGYNAISLYQFSDTSPSPSPPTPVPAPTTEPTDSEYTFLGCFGDVKQSRVFSVMADIDTVTAKDCAVSCAGYKYFGTQYGKECWCGDTGADPDANGLAECDIPCSGDADEVCGGYNAMSTYEFTDPGTSPTPTPGGFLDCYTDSKSARIMGSIFASNDGMTIEGCAELCAAYPYYGLQYSEECFCSDNDDFMEATSSTGCIMPCSGDSASFCGGYFAMSAYSQG